MIRILKHSAYRNGYLIITAAWLYTISFLFTNYFASDASAYKAAGIISNFVTAQENYFNKIVKDTSLLREVSGNDVSDRRSEVDGKTMGLFIYTINDVGHPVDRKSVV